MTRAEILDCLTDRPCDVCRFHESGRCERWDCVFEEKPDEPKQKTGHWEWVQYDYNPKLGNWHCSECRCIVAECVEAEKRGGIPLYKYCPQCGAKMEDTE